MYRNERGGSDGAIPPRTPKRNLKAAGETLSIATGACDPPHRAWLLLSGLTCLYLTGCAGSA